MVTHPAEMESIYGHYCPSQTPTTENEVLFWDPYINVIATFCGSFHFFALVEFPFQSGISERPFGIYNYIYFSSDSDDNEAKAYLK